MLSLETSTALPATLGVQEFSIRSHVDGIIPLYDSQDGIQDLAVSDHPTLEDFKLLLQGFPGTGEASRKAHAMRHLLASCPACLERFHTARNLTRSLKRLLELPDSPPRGDEEAKPVFNYEWAFARSSRTLAAFLGERGTGSLYPEAMGKLLSIPVSEQPQAASRGGRYADPQVIQALLEKSHAVRYENPEKMMHWANLARLAAEACTPAIAGDPAGLADLRADAWRQFGNALRVNGQLPESEKAFETALLYHEQGTGAPRLRGILLSQFSALRCYQRRFKEAIELADEAEALLRSLDERQLLSAALISKVSAFLYAGETEEATRLCHQAVSLLEDKGDPYLTLAAHHNLARCYIDLGQPAEALAIHCKVRDSYQECQDPLILLRATWQEGQLLREIGHLRNAETAFIRARQGFMEQGLIYEVGVISLDLAEVYHQLGFTSDLKRTTEEAISLLRPLRIARDTLAGLLRLQQLSGLDEPPA